jgi:hypothetical protein
MFEFDIRATVVPKGQTVPKEIFTTVKEAHNKLDCMAKLKKQLHKKGESLHFVLDIECFKRNIRKERVRVSDDALFDIESDQYKVHGRGLKTSKEVYETIIFPRKEPWEF